MIEDAPQPVLLVVDDEPLNRDLLRRVLFHDYEIVEAEDAAAAMAVLEAGDAPVDVLVCDQVMPGQSGTDLCTNVRTRWPHVVSLLLTGYEDAPEIIAAKKAGVLFDVIGKPWVAPALKDVIARAVEERRRRG